MHYYYNRQNASMGPPQRQVCREQIKSVIHDIIDTEGLDLLVLTEKNVPTSAPLAIRDDIASEGYLVLHSPRFGRKKRMGRRLAVINRDILDIKAVKSSFIVVPSAFKFLWVFARSTCCASLSHLRGPPKPSLTT
jgi:hypothetical protein